MTLVRLIITATLGWGLLSSAHAVPYGVTLAMPGDTAVSASRDTASAHRNPHRVRLWGWGVALLGMGMAVYGIAPFEDGENCELVSGFSCDETRRRQQQWLFFGGAALGSLGAGIAWSAQRDLDRRAAGLSGSPTGVVGPDERKNPWIGMGLGLAGAAAGTLLFWNDPGPAAMLVGIAAPSLGQLYAGTIPATAVSLAVRGGAGILRTKGTLDRKFGGEDSGHMLANTVYVTGVAISLFDIWGALHPPRETTARRAGTSLQGGAVSSFAVAPALFPLTERRLVPGLAVRATF